MIMRPLNRALSCGCIYEPEEPYVPGQMMFLSQGKCQELGEAMSMAMEKDPNNYKQPELRAWSENFDRHRAEVLAHPEWNIPR